MAKRERSLWVELNLFKSELVDLAEAAGVKLCWVDEGWDFEEDEGFDRLAKYIREAALRRARGR